MSFLDTTSAKKDYTVLGFTGGTNPFPVRGEVRPEVYHERPEVRELQEHLRRFVFDKGPGALVAVEAERGVGKSNLLEHIEWNLGKLEGEKAVAGVAHRYVGSQLVAPRQLAEQIVLALGEDRIRTWLESKPKLPGYIAETDFGRFVRHLEARPPLEFKVATQFLMYWLSGHQTKVAMRKEYNLWSRERLEAAAAFAYLRVIVDQLVSLGRLRGVILLLDEAEDILAALPRSQSMEYLMAIKALVNAFNFRHLLVIMAGQEGAVSRMGQLQTSLGSRWNVYRLLPVRSSKDAVALARTYMYAEARGSDRKPDDITIEAIFGRLAPKFDGRVPQRELLSELHRWVEENAGSRPRRFKK